MDNKTALVFGATGLTGSKLVELLVDDGRYSEIIVFVRRKYGFENQKIKVKLVDFSIPQSFQEDIVGHDVFCCLGSTMKQSNNSHTAFRSVDIDLTIKIAEMASLNKVSSFIVVSSIGASTTSRNFYLRTKGKMEARLKKIPFQNLVIVRPSILLGPRNDKRSFERAGQTMAKLFKFAFVGKLKKYRGINAKDLASAMIHIANQNEGTAIVENDKLLQIAHSIRIH